MKIYVASSWRNNQQPMVVKVLREAGHEVYDFRRPCPGELGFQWLDVDPKWKSWNPLEFANALNHPIAQKAFTTDMTALMECDVCVLVLPCGRSAHLEAGWAVGNGKHLFILLDQSEPELMYAMADHLCLSLYDLLQKLFHLSMQQVHGCAE